ncbi:helix-turn-helix domain-containing protein [Spirosoma fluviale]|uniref:DNA-binding transcriptional regulator, XRE-family HTH domain n=1 Tax=Spirosoma fluviale TaxID=1597977 RepID=A0A286GBY2_9BACT|nr:helix-turn-helix transcriptional regulator [Spirosoma fluviale]SOD92629.1 DNA-binding transcriptional regulator, XRE-family HTH domain [Spirosoma fluviale]
MGIATNIRQQRDKKKMSQRVLADLVGVAQSTIHNWESESSSPDGDEIKKLAEVLDVPISELFTEVVSVKVIQQNRDNSHSNNQHIHPSTQLAFHDELLSIQKELIQVQKARIISLEEEIERLRNQQVRSLPIQIPPSSP